MLNKIFVYIKAAYRSSERSLPTSKLLKNKANNAEIDKILYLKRFFD